MQSVDPRVALVLSATTLATLASTPVDAQAWRNAPRAPLTVFAYDQRAPLDYREEPVASTDSLLRTVSVSFASPSGGRVTGMLMRPTAAASTGRQLAGVVVLHGLPGDAKGALRSQGPELAKRGAVVLAIDAPWVRRSGMPDMTTRDSVEQVQLMRDLRRAVDVLIARTDVDTARIGYVGGSYGGAMGTLFVALEPRLRAATLFVADGGLVAHSTEPDGAARGPLASLSAREQAAWRAAMWPIEPQRFASYITRTPVLLQNGRTDVMVPAADAESLHKAITSPKTVEWYDSGHALPRTAFNARVQWLTEQLGLRGGA